MKEIRARVVLILYTSLKRKTMVIKNMIGPQIDKSMGSTQAMKS